MDDFTQYAFQPEWNLILLGRWNWRRQIEKARPAFLFVESAWRGNRGKWSYRLTNFRPSPGDPLYDLLEHCRQIGLPTVYWGKEDPPNFDRFKAAAREFDYVFTSDADCISRYEALCGHNRVYALPFAAQPVLHNPAGRRDSPDRQVAFAGGWYGDKHEGRRKYLPELFDAALELGLRLKIFDRFSDRRNKRSGKHTFPSRYAPYVQSRLRYTQMLSAYRMYTIFLNVNSVDNSPTMFSRRVFELLACGTSVVSSPSKGMERMLPGLVSVVHDREGAKQAIAALMADPASARRRAHAAYRAVMREHTYAHRAAEVLSHAAPAHHQPVAEPSVTVVLVTNRPARLAHALAAYRSQTHRNRQLVLVLNSDAFARDKVPEAIRGIDDVKLLQLPETHTLAACLNKAVEVADGQYWAKFDDDDEYGPEYLADALLPYRFTDASIVGKGTYFARIAGEPGLFLRRGGHEHRYVNFVCGGTLVVDRDAARDLRFDECIARGADTDWLRRAFAAGHRIYSADPYNFIQVRDLNAARHTWRIERREYLRSCVKVSDGAGDECVFV